MGLFKKKTIPVRIGGPDGTDLRCQSCGHDEFWTYETRLSLVSIFSWPRLDAMCYVCNRCGYIHWFAVQN